MRDQIFLLENLLKMISDILKVLFPLLNHKFSFTFLFLIEYLLGSYNLEHGKGDGGAKAGIRVVATVLLEW